MFITLKEKYKSISITIIKASKMTKQEFQAELKNFEDSEKEIQEKLRGIRAGKRNLLRKFLKGEDIYEKGAYLKNGSKSMILEKKDYALHLITSDPIIIYYGWACSSKAVRNKKDSRLTMFSYELNH